MPQLLTLREVADLLRLSPRTLYQPEWLERLRPIKVGRRWLVHRERVEAILRPSNEATV